MLNSKLLFIPLFILLGSCIKGQEYIKIVNNSDNSIVLDVRTFDNNPNDEPYDCDFAIFTGMNANSVEDYLSYGNGCRWELVLGTGYLQIIILDRDSYRQYWKEPCDTFCKYVPILHRYTLTVEDLEKLNWTITYPPEDSVQTDLSLLY